MPLRNSVDSDAQILSGNSWSPGLRFFPFITEQVEVQNILKKYKTLAMATVV